MTLVYHKYKCKILLQDAKRIKEHYHVLPNLLNFDHEVVDTWFSPLPAILHELRFGDFKHYASLLLVLDVTDIGFLHKLKKIFNECDHLKYLTKVLLLAYDDLSAKPSISDMGDTNVISIWTRQTSDQYTINVFIISFLHHVQNQFTTSNQTIQAYLQDIRRDYISNELLNLDSNWSTNEPLYFFSFNPALGVIINHNFFEKRTRHGSLKNVQSIIEFFERKRMSYILISDGSAEDVHRCMDVVRNSFMCAFEAILVFVMSHGGYGDIIYTKTLDYQIDEHIVSPLTANPMLSNVKIYIFVNACRGRYNPEKATFKHKDNVVPTDTQNQPHNVVKFYSTKINRASLRNVNTGSIFIEKICELLNQPYFEQNMEDLAKATEAAMAQTSLFRNGTTEFCIRPGTQHTMKVTFRNFHNFRKLLINMNARINGNCRRIDKKTYQPVYKRK